MLVGLVDRQDLGDPGITLGAFRQAIPPAWEHAAVKITIKDQGIGIPCEAKEYIFDRFYRAKNALPIQGTGIGLNIVKRHLQKVKGSIRVESEEKEGTKVFINLPLTIKDQSV